MQKLGVRDQDGRDQVGDISPPNGCDKALSLRLAGRQGKKVYTGAFFAIFLGGSKESRKAGSNICFWLLLRCFFAAIVAVGIESRMLPPPHDTHFRQGEHRSRALT